MTKHFTEFTRFGNWSYLFSYNCFSEICEKYALLSVSMQRPVAKCLPQNVFADIADLPFNAEITFSRNFENNGHKNVNFRKIFKSYPDELKFIPANVS